LQETNNISNAPVQNQQTLLDYINGKLSVEECYALEQKLDQDPFLADALEGLQMVQEKERIQQLTAQINVQLKHSLGQNKPKTPPKAQLPNWLLSVTILIILMLCILYFAFHFYTSSK